MISTLNVWSVNYLNAWDNLSFGELIEMKNYCFSRGYPFFTVINDSFTSPIIMIERCLKLCKASELLRPKLPEQMVQHKHSFVHDVNKCSTAPYHRKKKCHKQHITTIKLQFFENLRFSPASCNSTSTLPIHCTCFCGGAEKITAHISPHIMLFSSIYEALKVTNIRICLENMHRDRCLKAYWQTGLIYLFWLND